MLDLPTVEDIRAAAQVLDGKAVRTPLLTNTLLDEITGAKVWMKPECLQRTGSFKFRGAYNALHHGLEQAREAGVLAASSGNHAQGVAESARLFGCKASIIMPSDAPEAKRARTLRSGATVIDYDRHGDDREEVLRRMGEETGAHVVHPYENFHVIAGQGTCGLEIAVQLAEQSEEVDDVLVCAGGGGLMAGILLAMEDAMPHATVRPVEPEGYDDQRISHRTGNRVRNNASHPSVCDAIVTPMPGERSFAICKGKLGEGLVVSEEEVLRAVAFAYRELKLVVEPGGAVCLAALLAGRLDIRGRRVAITLSGGNMDDDMLARALAVPEPAH